MQSFSVESSHGEDGRNSQTETGEIDTTKEINEKETGLEKPNRSHFMSTYTLKPNECYEANHYSYETDRYGRIKHCEGSLRLEEGKRNSDHQVKAGGEYRMENDEGGHLIAKRFGGSEKIDNLVPMDSHVNRIEYRDLEEGWARELKKHNKVDVKVRCIYEGESTRPTGFFIKYRVTQPDGVSWTDTKHLKNESSQG